MSVCRFCSNEMVDGMIHDCPPIEFCQEHQEPRCYDCLKAEHATEIASIVAVIQRVEDPIIERGDRTLDDWLAQIFQVLVMDRGNYATECEQLKQQIERLTGERDTARASLLQVDEVLVVNWVGPRVDGDYAKALADLVTSSIQIHDDPAVSEVAAKRREEITRLRELLRRMCDHVTGVDQRYGWEYLLAQATHALEPPAKPIAGEP